MTPTANSDGESMSEESLRDYVSGPLLEPENGISVDKNERDNLPLFATVDESREIYTLDGKSPFTRDKWVQILSAPCVVIPPCRNIDPFYYDYKYFLDHSGKVFHRLAQRSELSQHFWQKIGTDREVHAVLVDSPYAIIERYFVSIPTGMPVSQAINSLCIHAATLDDIDYLLD